MVGISFDFPTLIFGDDEFVLTSSSVPDSVLRKKSSHTAYSFVCEGCEKDEWRLAYVKSADNVADICTKPIFKNNKGIHLLSRVLYHLE